MRNLKSRVAAAVTSMNLMMLTAVAYAQMNPGSTMDPNAPARADGSSMWGWVIGAVVLLAIIYALSRRRGAPRP